MARKTLNISLSPELERFIATRVESGRYVSASEVVRDGLRLLEDRERRREEALVGLREKIAAGVASLDRGDAVDGEEFFDRLEAELAATAEVKSTTA